MSDATKAVFLSYAREDTAAAQRIAEALRSHGVEVWFDQNELRGGDAWDQKIRRQINDCALFIPIISQHTQERGKGYFRLEWKLAVEQTHLMAEGIAFLAPVVVDATSESSAVVPPEFMRVQWTRLPGALPTPQFVEQIKRLLEAPRKAAPSPRPINSLAAATSPAPHPSGIPTWLAAVVVVVLLGAVAYFALRPSGKEPAAPPKPTAETKASVAPPAAPVPVVNDKSIAVLPFENMSEDKEANAFFADGMHEDILTNLANIRELRVVSRTSVMEYRGTTKKIPQIARELGVAYILEGSVRRSGSQVRITGQLIRAATDEHLWAKSYDRELTPKDIFAIQAALSTEIAGALRAALSPQEKSLIARRPTENAEAYDAYLKVRATRQTVTAGTNIAELRYSAEAQLEKIVRLDPNFAEAWAELARVRSEVYGFGIDHSPASLAKAKEALDTANRLAPDVPEVIQARGTYFYRCYRDYPRAIDAYETFVRLQPNNWQGYLGLGIIQRRIGRWPEALANLRKAVEIDPRSQSSWGNLSVSLELVRRYDEATSGLQRLAELAPTFGNRFLVAALGFASVGSTREVEAWQAQLTPEEANSSDGFEFRRRAAIWRGDYAEAIRLDTTDAASLPAATLLAAQGNLAGARARIGQRAEELKLRLEKEPTNADLWSERGQVEAILGHKEEALRCARRAVELIPESLDTLTGGAYSHDLAVVRAWIGDKDGAITELGRLLRVPGAGADATAFHEFHTAHTMRRDPKYFPLWGDPRFEALLNDPKNNEPLF